MASWWAETNIPRKWGADISPMYIGATIEIRPTAIPVIKRPIKTKYKSAAAALISAPIVKSIAVIKRAFLRPNLPLERPAAP